ncbi:hypothetical protein LMB49_10715 [Limosilactobacillus reuteri]|uniref:hypothetical protein n=1 Tax=Limosilactobacillus reuteri TaxID=1598 RepID=UPI001E5A4FEE|nr:hypothetical protein [Limosilactobacillus reuteri]MCC4370567.1 hypothetical protein [Limosilactobacillus reuteri]MCC4371864.1 hypothetical protein [Limosilactobacillus reuteri]MCC4509335.1 hypothetical protein [Limosilactobacillus reuteri]MCC4509378.1 hypothetical protein [Limosilactobacillus reuteri]
MTVTIFPTIAITEGVIILLLAAIGGRKIGFHKFLLTIFNLLSDINILSLLIYFIWMQHWGTTNVAEILENLGLTACVSLVTLSVMFGIALSSVGLIKNLERAGEKTK